MPKSPFRFRPEDAIGLCLIDLANILSRRVEGMLTQAGLSAPQWMVLLNVAGDQNFEDVPRSGARIYSSEIAAARGLSRPHISATVTDLIRRGLIVQEDDTADRRRKLLSVTPQGIALLTALQPVRQQINNTLLSAMSPVERETLLATLRGLRQHARQEEPTELLLAAG
jgi:MarR family transcriptional regulator, transcriptional regulator for hemolysin